MTCTKRRRRTPGISCRYCKKPKRDATLTGRHKLIPQSPEEKQRKSDKDEDDVAIQKSAPSQKTTFMDSRVPGSPGQAAKGTSMAGHVARPRSSQKPILSFSDELDEDEGISMSFSLSETTNKRFKTEQMISAMMPAPATYSNPLSIAEYIVPSKAAASLGQLSFGVSQARGARPYMEDRHTIVANYSPTATGGLPDSDGVLRSYAAVFDGHNGSQSAEEAASRLHKVLAAERGFAGCTGTAGAPAAEAEAAAMSGALESAFLAMDREILDRARRESGRDGCCVLVAVRIGDYLWTAHAGDSRAVLSRGGRSLRLTEDHKPGLERERQRVVGAGGRVEFQRCWRVISGGNDDDPGRRTGLAVSRSFGDIEFKEPRLFVERIPDVGRVQLLPEDSLIIMASDGLWDVLGDQQAVDIAHEAVKADLQKGVMAQAGDMLAKAASSALVFAALKKGTLDNVTVVVIMLRWD
ncbi:Protein phosphatase 2C homolog 3 [Coccomyxa sp. Obi]|nr:Protein phosphatase 2C homolog 3 [Coccomyxa sp. Obi]